MFMEYNDLINTFFNELDIDYIISDPSNKKTLEEAHDIADNLEKIIISNLNYIKEINIHTEPYKG